METFSALLSLCAGEFPSQKPVTQSFDVFFDLRLNKMLSKQSWGWWFETLSRSLWRQCNVMLSDIFKRSITIYRLWLVFGKQRGISHAYHEETCNNVTHFRILIP